MVPNAETSKVFYLVRDARSFFNQNGHYSIPSRNEHFSTLYRWASKVRAQYKNDDEDLPEEFRTLMDDELGEDFIYHEEFAVRSDMTSATCDDGGYSDSPGSYGKRNDDDSLFSHHRIRRSIKPLKQVRITKMHKDLVRMMGICPCVPHPVTLPPTVMKTALSWRTMDSYSLRQAPPYVRKVIV